MQKQLILCMSVPDRTTRAKYEMTAAIKEIRGVDHLICDLYDGKIKLARYVVSDKEYGKFLYLENRWSQDIKYYSDIRFFGEYECSIFPKTAVSDETIKVLKKYGIKAPVNSTYARKVNEKMSDIYYAKEKEKEKLQSAETQRLFEMVPAIPEEFTIWAKGLFDSKLLSLIYKRETKYRAVVTCCRCGQTPTVRTNSVSPNVKTIPVPQEGQLGECQWCHATGRYRQVGRYKSNRLNENCYLFQSLPDGGLLVRYFELQLREYFGRYEINMLERSRIFLNINTKTKTFWNHTYYGDGREYWRSYNAPGTGSYYLGSGPIFRGYDDAVKSSSLAYADYKAYAYAATYTNHSPHTDDYIDALSAYAYFPKIEYLYKSGYESIVRHLVSTHSITSLINKKGKSIPEMLKIKSNRVKYIKEKRQTLNYLEALQFECKNNLNLSDDEIEWMVKMSGHHKFYDELVKLLKLMSFRKLYNRVREYAVKEYKDSDVNSWIAFRDYMIMREELGYDMTNSVYLHPRSLRNAHAEMVSEKEHRENEKYISEKMQKFTQIPERYKKLKKKYSMESNGYLFIPAHDAGEIVVEGRTLHHCVGSSNTYMSRHDRGEGAIIFMRNIKAPDVPYVTIEINIKDQRICQWYGAHDKKPQEEATLNAIHDFEMLLESLKTKKKKASKAAADDIAQPVLMPAAV